MGCSGQEAEERSAAESSESDPFREPYLDGKRMRLSEGPSGLLRLTIEGERSYLRVKVARARPITDPNHYIGFWDGANKEIGLLREPRELDPESGRALARALRRRYLVPTILGVRSVAERFGISTWLVETDRGLAEFSVVDHGENLRHLGEGRVSIEDIDGNRFDLPDYRRLDPRSREILEKMV